MIIDFHTHVFPAKIAQSALSSMAALSHTQYFSAGTAEALQASMAENGVSLSIVLPVATNPKKVVSINNSAADINRHTQESGLFSFGCIHPDCEDWYQELGRIAELGMKGIKLHPAFQGTDFDDPRYLRILNRAGELGLIVLFHAGLDDSFPNDDRCPPEKILQVIRQVGPVRLIAAHMGGWKQWEHVEELLAETNVFLDTSASFGFVNATEGYYASEDLSLLNEEQFLHMVRTFGADRILYGSDSPWERQRESIEWLQNLPLTPQEKTAIFSGTAKKLLGL
jgi:predicted TIM-barrel fold metal-dependent hydrolase